MEARTRFNMITISTVLCVKWAAALVGVPSILAVVASTLTGAR